MIEIREEVAAVEFAEEDIVVVAPHRYLCSDGQMRFGAGGRYLVKFKFNNGNFFGEPMDGRGYLHVVAAEHIRWKAE